MKKLYLLICLALICLLPIPVNAGIISGTVRSAGTPLKGVVVTDGYNFFRTDAKGNYTLPSNPSARFIYVSTPSGYTATSENGVVKFYSEIRGEKSRYDFDLQKKKHNDTIHSFIVFADPQIWAGKEFAALSVAVKDIKETITALGPGAEVHAICAGDIVSNDHSFYGEYNRTTSTLGVPVYNAMGNHDMTLYGRAMEGSEKKYCDTFGPQYYSYNVGKIHYVTLNDNFYIGRDYFYNGYLEERQLAWLEKDLSYIPKGSTVVVTMHIPGSCEPADRGAFKYQNAGNTLINYKGLYDLLSKYNAHIISGHTHTAFNQQIKENLYEHVTPALSGAWWQGSLCTDGTPAGYSVFRADGSKLSWYYKSTGYNKDYQMKIYNGNKYSSFKGWIVANIWNSDTNWKIELYEDGVLSENMERFRAYDPEAIAMYSDNSKLDHKWIYPSESDHFYRAKPKAGTSVAEVVATDRFGNVYRNKITLNNQADTQYYDVLVIGGGTSGTAAGIESARGGARTLIAEESTWLGGMLTSAGVSATDGNFKLKGGIWGEFRDSLAKHYGSEKALATGWVSNILFEPSVGDRIFKNIAGKEANLSILYNCTAESFTRNGGEWTAYLSVSGKKIKVIAKILIDGTELGDVAKATGVKYDTGMDSRSVSGESIAPEKGNNIIQDLTYALVLKEYPSDVTPVKPASYDPSLFYCCCENEKCINPKEKKRIWSRQMMITYGKLPNNKYMINWPIEGNDYYVNTIEMSREERVRAMEKAKEMSLAFLYYLQTELGFKRLGIADDEFPTHDGLPFIAYHRESRRIHGVVRFTLNDITEPYTQNEKLYRTAAGVGDYPVDQHHTRYHEWETIPDLHFFPIPSYGFPLGIVIPENVENLIVAEKSVSVTNLVNGSTRLQPVVLQIGQASGALAALAIKQNIMVSKVKVRDLQRRILEAGGYLLPYLDLKPENRNFKAMQRIGVTGILKGTGMNKGWENQTWFFADSLLTVNTLDEGLAEVYPGFKKSARSEERVTMSALIDKIAQISGINSDKLISILNAERERLGIGSADPGRLVTRLETAVIIDRLIDPFGKLEIDIHGNYIH